MCLCRKALFEEDFDQFQMDRGYCVIGGPTKYSPQLVRSMVFDKPNAWRTVTARALEITGRLGLFLGSLSLDKMLGRNNQPATVAKRASQLRYTILGKTLLLKGQCKYLDYMHRSRSASPSYFKETRFMFNPCEASPRFYLSIALFS